MASDLELLRGGLRRLITGSSLTTGVSWVLMIVFFETIWLKTVCEGGSSSSDEWESRNPLLVVTGDDWSGGGCE